MDLFEFIKLHKNNSNSSLNCLMVGFENSPFSNNNNCDTGNLVKDILKKMLPNDNVNSKNYYINANGGIQILSKKSKIENHKKQSYCVEFNTMMDNILGLLGFEFSYCILTLITIDNIIKKYIEGFSLSNNYIEAENFANIIKNIYNLGDCIMIEQTIESKYININNDSINYFDYTNVKNQFFNGLLSEITLLKKNDTIINFNEDIDKWHNELLNLYKFTNYNQYYIQTIDQLCINMGKTKYCYDGHFIKIFETVYKELFVDIDSTKIKPDFTKSTSTIIYPHIEYLDDVLKIQLKPQIYINNFISYYHKIYDDTIKSTLKDNMKKLNIIIDENLYLHLAHITLNLYINIAKKISNNQKNGKSTRIQFSQVFQAIEDSMPRCYNLTPAQKSILHYILLSNKVLADSLKTANILLSQKEK